MFAKHKTTLTPGELNGEVNSLDWGRHPDAPRSVAGRIAYLKQTGQLLEHTLHSAAYSKTVLRYSWTETNVYQLALSLAASSYLSHKTAAIFHGLLPVDDPIYVNIEQSQKPVSANGLTQPGIDRAFSRPQRISNLQYDWKGETITVLNGKHTSCAGVMSSEWPGIGVVRTTNLERTLIDIVVRPEYGGGIAKLQEAYRNARERTSISSIVETLASLRHSYPYHQAIGFLLSRAGLSDEQLSPLRMLGMQHDFYVGHGDTDRVFNHDWKVWYSKTLDR